MGSMALLSGIPFNFVWATVICLKDTQGRKSVVEQIVMQEKYVYTTRLIRASM